MLECSLNLSCGTFFVNLSFEKSQADAVPSVVDPDPYSQDISGSTHKFTEKLVRCHYFLKLFINFFFFKIYNITLDPDPNWVEILDSDPILMNLNLALPV